MASGNVSWSRTIPTFLLNIVVRLSSSDSATVALSCEIEQVQLQGPIINSIKLATHKPTLIHNRWQSETLQAKLCCVWNFVLYLYTTVKKSAKFLNGLLFWQFVLQVGSNATIYSYIAACWSQLEYKKMMIFAVLKF